MSAKTDKAALKQAIRARMLALEEGELATAREHAARFLGDAQLDDREGHDNSDIAESRESADLAAAFDGPVHAHQAKVDAIEALDFGPSDQVGPGAIVVFKGRRFVVAVSTAAFECEGESYMGISTQSPIYGALEGLKKGESFTFNGRKTKLEDVF